MAIFIIILGVVIWYFVSFQKEKNKQKEKLNLYGGFHNVYEELINFFLEFKNSKVIERKESSITVVSNNSFSVTHFYLTHSFNEVHLTWDFRSVKYGDHKLKWTFPEYQLQSSMIKIIGNDVTNYLDSKLYMLNSDTENTTNSIEVRSSNSDYKVENITEIKCAMKLMVTDNSNVPFTKINCSTSFNINYNDETITVVDRDNNHSEIYTKHKSRSNFSGLDNTFFSLTDSTNNKYFFTIYKSNGIITAVRLTDSSDSGWLYFEANYILNKINNR